jgi:hypothetical protein
MNCNRNIVCPAYSSMSCNLYRSLMDLFLVLPRMLHFSFWIHIAKVVYSIQPVIKIYTNKTITIYATAIHIVVLNWRNRNFCLQRNYNQNYSRNLESCLVLVHIWYFLSKILILLILCAMIISFGKQRYTIRTGQKSKYLSLVPLIVVYCP